MADLYKYYLTVNGNTTLLTIEPDGWADIGASYERNATYKGVLRSYALQLVFTQKKGGGGDLLVAEFDRVGVKGSASLEIQVRNHLTNDYETLYTGIISFDPDSFENNVEDYTVSCDIEENSKIKLLKARENLKLNVNNTISVDGVSIEPFADMPKPIEFRAIDVYNQVQGNGYIDLVDIDYGTGTLPPILYNHKFNGDIIINDVSDRCLITDPSTDYKVYVNSSDETKKINLNKLITNFTFSINVSGLYDIKVYFNFRMYDSDDNQVSISGTRYPFEENGNFTGNITRNVDSIDNAGAQFVALPDYYITLKYVIRVEGYSVSPAANLILSNQNITVNFVELVEGVADSDINTWFPYEIGTRLIQLMTSETDTSKLLYSSIFGRTDSEFDNYDDDGSGAYDVMLNGKMARQFPDTSLNISFKDYFEAYSSIRNLGMGFDNVNDRFFIEGVSQFFKDEEMFDLGDVSDLTLKPLDTEFYSQIVCGFGKKLDHEQTNGNFDFTEERNYSVTVPSQESKLLNSNLSTSGLAIEFSRRKPYNGFSTEDTIYDDLNIIVNTNGLNANQGRDGLEGSETFETMYNIAISPRENMLRHSNILKVPMWKTPETIRFVNSLRNSDFIYTNQNGDSVSELSDIQYSELKEERLFDPVVATFRGVLTSAMVKELNTDPHRYFSFSFRNVNYQGFVKRITPSDYSKESQFEAILKPVSVSENNFVLENNRNFVMEDNNNFIFE